MSECKQICIVRLITCGSKRLLNKILISPDCTSLVVVDKMTARTIDSTGHISAAILHPWIKYRVAIEFFTHKNIVS